MDLDDDSRAKTEIAAKSNSKPIEGIILIQA